MQTIMMNGMDDKFIQCERGNIMTTHEFSLVLHGVNKNTSQLTDILFNAGCDDGLVCTYGNTIYIDFMREANCYKEAVLSAIKDVESAGLNVQVRTVDAGDYVGITDIANLSSLSKKTISAFKDGKRGPGNFPSPIQRLKNTSPIWRWSDVATWLAENGKVDAVLAENALLTEAFNKVLEQRLEQPEVQDLVAELSHAVTQ